MQFNKYTYIHTHTVSLIPPREDQCEWHRMTRMTGPDCVVMCNLINTYIHTNIHIHHVAFGGSTFGDGFRQSQRRKSANRPIIYRKSPPSVGEKQKKKRHFVRVCLVQREPHPADRSFRPFLSGGCESTHSDVSERRRNTMFKLVMPMPVR